MSAARTTRILAAGKSLRRATPEGRLQRKMAARSPAPTQSNRPVAAETPTAPVAVAESRRSPMLPVPLTVSQRDSPFAANGGSGGGSIAGGPTADGRGACPGSCQESNAAKTRGAAVDRGGARGTAKYSKDNSSMVRATTVWGSGGGTTAVAGRHAETVGSRSPAKTTNGHNSSITTTNINNKGNDGRSDNPPPNGTAEVSSRSPRSNPDAPDPTGRGGNGKDGHEGKPDSPGGVENSSLRLPPRVGCAQPRADDRRRGLSRPTTPGSDGAREEDSTLGGLRGGPVRDVLAALLTSTVMGEDGGRVLMPSFPSVSALRELKYCGPLEPLQASALGRVLVAR